MTDPALDAGALAPETFTTLRAANVARQEAWCAGGDPKPDLSFRGIELAGEVGEALNVIKKLERERHGWRGSRATVDDLADELADVVICADLAADAAGIDLDAAVVRKFNATSEKVGLPQRLSALPGHAADEGVAFALKIGRDCRIEAGGSDCSNPLNGKRIVITDIGSPAPAPQGEDAELIARLRERAARWRGNDNFEDTSLSTANVCEEAANRLAALSAENTASMDTIERERGRAERAEAALAVKDKALEPFAELGQQFTEGLPSDEVVLFSQNGFHIRIGHLHDARAARQAGATMSVEHEFQQNGPGIVGSDICTVCGKEREVHDPREWLIRKGRAEIAHDGFAGDIIGHYVTREGKRGVVVQQDGTRVVHVYGEKWLPAAPSPALREDK